MSLYPLQFRPRFVEKMWGGRKIETVLGKPLPAGKQIGESWELYDFPPGVVEASSEWVSSEIANGPHVGRTLHWAVEKFGRELTGDADLVGAASQFPILIKFLDAREDLSVQVHPDEEFARSHPGAHLKSEAWYVIEHDPEARLFKGLTAGTSRDAFANAVEQGVVENHLIQIKARRGDCFYLPSGTVHALGAGMLVAEVQTPSDTTFRVYDFNRIDPATHKRRALHVEQAMQCIDFDDAAQAGVPVRADAGKLVECDYFHIEKKVCPPGQALPLPTGQPRVWIVLEGDGEIRVANQSEPIRYRKGQTLLMPASMANPMLKTLRETSWLEVTFPEQR